MRSALIFILCALSLLTALRVQGLGSEKMGRGRGGMNAKRPAYMPKMGGMSSSMKKRDSGMDGMALPGMTQRGKPRRMGGMSQGMTERRAIGMSRMAQGVPGISDKKKGLGRPSKTRGRGSAGMEM